MVLPDALSRLSQADKKEIPGLEIRVHHLVDVSTSRMSKLQKETDNDEVLQKIKHHVQNRWPNSVNGLDDDIKPYWGIHDDISYISMELSWLGLVL